MAACLKMLVHIKSVSPAASSELQDPGSAELDTAAEPEASEETAEASETAETVESSEPEESRESTSMPETATGGDPSSEAAVSAGDVKPSDAPVSGGDPALPETAAPSEAVSGGDVLPPAKDTVTKPYDASVDYSGLEDLFAELQETEIAQLESLTRIEAQNEAVISILLIILVVGLLHYIYRFLKMFV